MSTSLRSVFIVLVAVVAAACGSDAAQPVVAESQADVTTTVPPTTSVAPSTTQAPTTSTEAPTTTEAVLDESAMAQSATWDRYRTVVPPERAIHCAIAVEIDPNYTRTIPEDLVLGDLLDLYIDARRLDTDEADAAYRSVVVQVDAADFLPRLSEIESGLAILDATTDVASAKETFAASSGEVEAMLAEIEAGAETVDLAPYLRIALDEFSAAYEIDNGCPFTGGTDSPIASAMSNFGGTNERFGGRGPDARSRCHIAAAVDLALEATAAGEPFDDLVEHSLNMFEQQWFDRPIDAEAAAAATAWRDGVAAGDDPAALASATLDLWLDYREGAPEGFILCPLDRGWEA